MKKFAGVGMDVTDLVSEGNINYLANLIKGDPDELEKNAHIPSKDEVADLPGEEFALVLYHPQTGFLKKYATRDKYITKVNMKIFADKCNEYPDEIAKTAAHYLVKAAKSFRLPVPEEIQKLAAGNHVTNIVDLTDINQVAWANKQKLTKTAAAVEYALPEQKKYPIHTPEMVKKAVEYFDTHAHRFDPLVALQFAGAVKTAAVKHQVAVENTTLAKYATLTSKNFNPEMRVHLKVRKNYVDADQAGVYDELLEKSAELGVIKTAEYLAKVDRKFGLHRQWGRAIEDPYLTVLGHTKEANSACCHKGKKVAKNKMLKAAEAIVDADTLKELSGPDGIEVFDSLPTPLKDKIINNA